jgi:hypothetical protein
MSSQSIERNFSINKSITKSRGLKIRKKDKNSSSLTTIGVIINIVWVSSVFLNPPIESSIFLMLGVISLFITFLIKLYYRFFVANEISELQGGGSIVGYVTSWFIAQYFYDNKANHLNLFENNFTVDQILQYYLIFAFIIWFVIPSTASSQELIFNFSPILSYFILNLWKLLIVLKFIINMWNLRYLDIYITTILILVYFFEIIGMYQRIFKIDISDIILDLPQIIIEIVRGPLISIKWISMLLLLMIFNLLDLDRIIILALFGFSLLMLFISITTFISKLSLDSGLFQKKADQAKSVIPEIFTELKELKVQDIHENYYEVIKEFSLTRKTKVLQYSVGDFLFKIPLKNTLTELTGHYVAKITFDQNSKRKQRRRSSSKVISNINSNTNSKINSNRKIKSNDFQIKLVRKFTVPEWNELENTNKISVVSTEKVTETLGFENKAEFDEKIQIELKNFSKYQDNVRDRIRGVPVSSEDEGQIFNIENFTNNIPLPESMIQNLKEQGVKEIEILPGKDEFIYYIKKRT